jgi:hypothetical protein
MSKLKVFLKFNKDLVEFIGDYWDYKGLFNGFFMTWKEWKWKFKHQQIGI